jgi:NAD(P)-dependent dehydrogenase (short-subunit alcohol dehydrogenase family)
MSGVGADGFPGLSGLNVLVTGGAAGIGRAGALACAASGASVAVVDLDAAAAEAVAAEARSAGAPATVGLACDVRSEDAVAAAVAAAADRLGPLGGLVTSAGIARGGLVHEQSLEQWREVVDTNLTGTFLACKHALAHMLEARRGGSIVCVASPLGEVAVPGGATAYSASKGGVSALVRSLAIDYAPHGIRVNAVVPGTTETALMWWEMPEDEIPAARRQVENRLPLARLAEPAEIAVGIAFLLSERATYVTGSHLAVDGGLMARAAIDS